MTCRFCGSENFTERESGPHVGRYCADCGRLDKWVKQEQNVETGEPASPSQLSYAMRLLCEWQDSGKSLTKRQAGAIISAFKA